MMNYRYPKEMTSLGKAEKERQSRHRSQCNNLSNLDRKSEIEPATRMKIERVFHLEPKYCNDCPGCI